MPAGIDRKNRASRYRNNPEFVFSPTSLIKNGNGAKKIQSVTIKGMYFLFIAINFQARV